MKFIASWSGGKDSTASIILAHENNEPLDLIIFSEVMFDKNISGEFPEHIDFIKKKYGYTEQMAFDLCKEYDLLSPIYDFAPRGGCWFCPNARDCELRHLRNNHRDLWDKLLELEETPNLIGNIWNTLTQTSIHDKEEQFFWEDNQINLFDYARSLETTI